MYTIGILILLTNENLSMDHLVPGNLGIAEFSDMHYCVVNPSHFNVYNKEFKDSHKRFELTIAAGK